LKLCRQPLVPAEEIPIGEWRDFALATRRIAADPALLQRLIDAVDRGDALAFDALVKQLGPERFCHQLCHWLCLVRCRYICRLLCPPPPLITEVGFIPTGQIDVQGYRYQYLSGGMNTTTGSMCRLDPLGWLRVR